MKKLLFVFTLLSSLVAFSQAQFFMPHYSNTGGSYATGFAVKDNFLYFGCNDGLGIRKINLNGSPGQTPVVVFTGGTNVQDLVFNGNELYISEFGLGKISKIDLSLPNPVMVDVISGLMAPTGMQIYNNYLYISEAYNYCVSRINLNQTNPVKEVVVAANGPWQIQVYGDELYVAETYGNKISKFNLLDPTPTLVPVVQQISYPYGMCIKDNILYYDYFISTNVPKLSKIDLTSPSPISEAINSTGIENISVYSSLVVHNNFIYRGGALASIQRFIINTLSNSGELIYENNVGFYPNPATNQITFNESVKSVVVYTLEGKLIPTQLDNNTVDVSHLSSGMYIVQITDENDDSMTQKLIKE